MGGAGHDLLFGNAGNNGMTGGPADDVPGRGDGRRRPRGLGGDDEAFGGRGTDDCVAETEVDCER
jgi:Ca2+-binding RTX toxin-like protein